MWPIETKNNKRYEKYQQQQQTNKTRKIDQGKYGCDVI